MDAFELLKEDHRKVSQLFSEIESASGPEKTRLFGQLKSELDLHAHIEETVLYPALENTDEAREITLEAYEEHNVVKDLLSELANAGSPNEEWDAKLTVLKENVEHHVEEEESELFDKARKVLSEERLESLGAELEAEKSSQTLAKPAGAAKAKKAATNKKAKDETPGVLKRLASFIGLAEPIVSERAGSKKSAGSTKKSGTKRSAAKSASKTKAGARSSVKTSASSKSAKGSSKPASKARKAPAKKGAKKSATKARSSTRTTPAKKAAPLRARASASKSAARPASNTRVKPGSGRKAFKPPAKPSTGSRRKAR